MRRAHLRRSIGGGRRGPLRYLPQESVVRAKPALEVDHPSLSSLIDGVGATVLGVPRPSAGKAGATNPGGRFRKGGEAPLRVSWRPRRRLAAGPFSSL